MLYDIATIVGTAIVIMFYAIVLSAVLITFWKIHVATSELAEIKKILLEMKDKSG